MARKEVKKVERQILVALLAQRFQTRLHELGRSHGRIAKALGIDGKQARLLMLQIAKEAVEFLIEQAEAEEK